jgi:hypothetical protein
MAGESALRVSVNGKRICTAWVGPDGVIDAIIGWGGKPGTLLPANGLRLSVGGIDSPAWEHVNWRTPKLKVGDVVTVEIVEADAADPSPEWKAAKGPRPPVAEGESAKPRRGKRPAP